MLAVTNRLDEQDAELMGRFCSLGENCELGMAQRGAGAEPADLLRWARIGVPALLTLLADAGDQIGDESRLNISINGKWYWIEHEGYGFGWHSLLRVGKMPERDVIRREARRMPLLARGLINDLGEGTRIFVLKRQQYPITAREAEAVLSAMHEYGDATLMYVTQTGEGLHPKVRRVGDRLLHGTIIRFADDTKVAADTPVALWRELCRRANEFVEAPTV